MKENMVWYSIRKFFIFGLPFGLLYGSIQVIGEGLKEALLYGLFGGVYFGFIMSLVFTLSKLKSIKYLMEKFVNETVIMSGEANYKRQDGPSGWLYLTDTGLYYKSKKIELAIPVNEITGVTDKSVLALVHTISVQTEKSNEEFLVLNRKKWVKAINKVIDNNN